MRLSKKEFIKRYLAVLSEVERVITDIKEDESFIKYVAEVYALQQTPPSLAPRVFALKEITGEYDYLIRYDENVKAFYGKPVIINEGIEELKQGISDRSITYSLIKDGFLAVPIDMNDVMDFENFRISYKEIKSPDLSKWSVQIEGIDENGVTGKYKDLVLPECIKYLQEGCLAAAECNKLCLQMAQLSQLARTGLRFSKGYQVRTSDTKGFSLHKGISEKLAKNKVRYRDALSKGINIIIYNDRITLEKDDKEYEFIPGFKYKQFYESRDNLIKCLLLTYFGILSVSPVEEGMSYIYNQIIKDL